MRVLVLSWDVGTPGDGGMAPQAAGLAATLGSGGHDVRVVTRLGEAGAAPSLPDVEVHAVVDAPPIIPASLAQRALAAEAVAARALSVAVRRLRERPADVVHAVGWQTGPVVVGLRAALDVPVTATLTAADVDAARLGDHPVAIATELARAADVVLAPTRHDRDRVVRAGGQVPVQVVPPGVELPPRSPGPPPQRGPLHLTAPAGTAHREVAAAVRDAANDQRRITRSWRRHPFAVAVLDPFDLDAAVRALALGVPLLAVEGPVGELATGSGGGMVVAPTGAAVAAAVDQLAADPRLAGALGAVGAAAALDHGWERVAAAWRATVRREVAPGPTRLRAAR